MRDALCVRKAKTSKRKTSRPREWEKIRERVLFIGTQFSILYTFMYSPA